MKVKGMGAYVKLTKPDEKSIAITVGVTSEMIPIEMVKGMLENVLTGDELHLKLLLNVGLSINSLLDGSLTWVDIFNSGARLLHTQKIPKKIALLLQQLPIGPFGPLAALYPALNFDMKMELTYN